MKNTKLNNNCNNIAVSSYGHIFMQCGSDYEKYNASDLTVSFAKQYFML